jgi:hypothetical protein
MKHFEELLVLVRSIGNWIYYIMRNGFPLVVYSINRKVVFF